MDIKRIDVSPKLKIYETSAKEKDAVKNVKNKPQTDKAAVNKGGKKENDNKIDKITISSEAKNLNILDFANAKIKYEMSKELTEINNAEKINALKEQIKKGEYRIDSKDLADALISGGTGL